MLKRVVVHMTRPEEWLGCLGLEIRRLELRSTGKTDDPRSNGVT